MKKWYLLIFIGIVLLTFVSAEQSSLGVIKQNTCVILYQTCDDCTYVNLTAIKYPNGTTDTYNVAMTKTNQNFNYSFCKTSQIGDYTYTVAGDKGGVYSTEVIAFEVSPSGFTGTLGFYILILVFSAGIMILGFSKDDGWMVVFGSLGLYFVGLYMLFFGIDGMKDQIYTNSFAIIVLGIAAYISIRSAWEMIRD